MVIFEIWVILNFFCLFVLDFGFRGVFLVCFVFLLVCFGLFSYSVNLGANLDEVVGGGKRKDDCQKGNRKIWERRNAFIYCFHREERISAFFNMQITDKENTCNPGVPQLLF